MDWVPQNLHHRGLAAMGPWRTGQGQASRHRQAPNFRPFPIPLAEVWLCLQCARTDRLHLSKFARV